MCGGNGRGSSENPEGFTTWGGAGDRAELGCDQTVSASFGLFLLLVVAIFERVGCHGLYPWCGGAC